MKYPHPQIVECLLHVPTDLGKQQPLHTSRCAGSSAITV